MSPSILNGGGVVNGDAEARQFVVTDDQMPNIDEYISLVAKRFKFNILLVGAPGCGKSTIIDTLFPTNQVELSMQIEGNGNLLKFEHFIEEDNARLKLGVVEVQNHGDQPTVDECCDLILKFIEKQLYGYLANELSLTPDFESEDNRVHLCLYFIAPSVKRLSALDVKTMKSIHKRVNLIPVIAKADSVTRSEVADCRAMIRREMEAHGIETYQFPVNIPDLEVINRRYNEMMPFTLIGSTDVVCAPGGKTMRARQYAWGIVDVMNEAHCDVKHFQECLVRYNIFNLVEDTAEVKYEQYRRHLLSEWGYDDAENPLINGYKNDLERHLTDCHQREEDLKKNFLVTIKEEEDRLKEVERQLSDRNKRNKNEEGRLRDALKQRRNELDRSRKEFDEMKAACEKQIQANRAETLKKKPK